MSSPAVPNDSAVKSSVYDNLTISPLMFLPSKLPLDAKVTGDLALLGRSRAILFACTAMYLIDLNGGQACQPPATTQIALLQAKREISRQMKNIAVNTSRRNPGGQVFHDTVESLLHMDAEKVKPSVLGSSWKPSCRNLLDHAVVELEMYDTLAWEVRAKATDKEVREWHALCGGGEWRERHDAAMKLMSGWYRPASATSGVQQVWENGMRAVRRGWGRMGL